MRITRRHFINYAVGGGVLALLKQGIGYAHAQEFVREDVRTPINIIIPKDYQPPRDDYSGRYRAKLSRAALEYLEENYSERRLPVWEVTFDEVDLEKRVTNIVHWIMLAVQKYVDIYPLDPAWILAQIMKESYFYEFAISKALAVGICQFIQPTAKAHGILCAGDKPSHSRPPYKLPSYAGSLKKYYRFRRERRKYERSNEPRPHLSEREAIKIIAEGKAGQYQKTARKYLKFWEKVAEYDRKVVQARDQYREYLEANVKGRDIFDDNDLRMILKFDERFTYKKPILAMVKMLSKGLRARNGNIVAATVGFNAGLSSTKGFGAYEPYGRIPASEQATTYISHVLINHYEIVRRM